MSKQDQSDVKDVGGYVGGYLRQGKRSPLNVVERHILTLDVDFASTGFFTDFTLLYDCAAFLHATHKHSPSEPRLRLLIPLDRGVTVDEYTAISRKVAGALGIGLFDNTTFEVNRLMYWPSHPVDVEYYYEQQTGPLLCADEVLASYKDWTDSSSWPTAEAVIREIGEAAQKQEDPHLKKGIVGAFCRTYSITDAIDTLLPDEYEQAQGGRYTYKKGSTSGGVVIYSDTFSYSHHGTDPASGKLCNAFDLVRLHKFGHLDEHEKSKKSFSAMEEFAMADTNVRKTLAQENYEEARSSFSEPMEVEAQDIDWMDELEINRQGEYLSTANNINLIFQNDKFLKGAFKYNLFDGKRYLFKSVPWRSIKAPEPLRNVDYSGIRNYIECIYSIASQHKIEDSLSLEIERNTYHPIREYLDGLKWDGTPRLHSTLCDYFGAEDSAYTHEVFRKWMAGAVSRIYWPGCKFDLVLVLVDPKQGSAKSTFFSVLGREWFSDTFTTVHGKEALEQIQGAWLIEIAELAGLRKADVEAVKHFITKQRDQFRPAYGRTAEIYERQCVFAGTTNNSDFLRDPSGNRRFLPVDVVRSRVKKSVFKDLAAEVPQLWAEAVHYVKQGEELYLSKEIEQQAELQQKAHSETDQRTGLVEQYLERLLPDNWDSLDVYERRNFLASDLEGTERRSFVCVAEVWAECFGNKREEMSRYNTREVNDLLRSLDGWRSNSSTKNFNLYGKQRYYERDN